MPKTPTYRRRKGYTQAIVTLTDAVTKRRRDYWLGEHGSAESRERYHRLIATWEAGDRRLPEAVDDAVAGTGNGANGGGGGRGGRASRGRRSDAAAARPATTVSDVLIAYWRFAKDYYRPNEVGTLKVALRLLRRYHGTTPAAAFGPKKLRMLRDEMVRGDAGADPPREPWSRSYCNQQTRRIRQVFKWAASREMVPSSVYQALATLEPLKRGRCAAREGRVVGPAPMELVEASTPHMSRQVAALVNLQLLTGARPGELLRIRAVDIETNAHAQGPGMEPVWTYRPREHKNAYRGKARTIYFGPAAQEVLRPFMAGRALDAFLFSPREAEAERRAAAAAGRNASAGTSGATGGTGAWGGAGMAARRCSISAIARLRAFSVLSGLVFLRCFDAALGSRGALLLFLMVLLRAMSYSFCVFMRAPAARRGGLGHMKP